MSPRPSFDRLAPAYRFLELLTFGSLLHRCRVAHLDWLAGCRSVLVLGDGDGRFVADLLRRHPAVQVDSIDISRGMLTLARRRVPRLSGAATRVRFVRADARSEPPPATGYDAVVTNFFLDCFEEEDLAAVVRRAVNACSSAAVWIDGDFRLPSGAWPRRAARIVLAAMYLFFRLATRLPARRLIDPAPYLEARGFALAEEKCWLRGGLTSRVWVRESDESAEDERTVRRLMEL